jgi:hypothetical protein
MTEQQSNSQAEQKQLKRCTPVQLTDKLIRAIPQPYPTAEALQGAVGLVIELIAHRYKNEEDQLKYVDILVEILKTSLKQRMFLQHRMNAITEQLKKEGRPFGNQQVLAMLQREMREAADRQKAVEQANVVPLHPVE